MACILESMVFGGSKVWMEESNSRSVLGAPGLFIGFRRPSLRREQVPGRDLALDDLGHHLVSAGVQVDLVHEHVWEKGIPEIVEIDVHDTPFV